MSTTLTIAMLREAGACPDELDRLETIFGSSVEITEELCVAHAADCDWNWAVRLLTAPARAEYDTAAWAEYDLVRDAARAEDDTAAWSEYDRAKAAAWARLWIKDRECG